MPLTPADVQAIWDHQETNVSNGQPTRMGAIMRYADFLRDQQTKALTAQLGALSAAVSALAKGGGLTAEQVQAAAQAGAAAALAELEAALKQVTAPTPAPAKP